MAVNDLAGKRVLIWGIGRHGGGVAAARFCAAAGAEVRLIDKQEVSALGKDGEAVLAAGWAHATGDAAHPWFMASDLIVASPAIPPRAWPAPHPPVRSPESLFLAAHTGPRIAVTGTKGKSTTAMLTAAVLGWEVAGNSYEPLLEVLVRRGAAVPIVCELSSFQLWYLRDHRPRFQAAILTSLGRDHLDWHPDLEHYHRAKTALLGWGHPVVVAAGLESKVPAGTPLLPRVAYENGVFRDGVGDLAVRADLPLLGEHNAHNAALALAAALACGAPRDRVRARLQAVRPLPHRLQTVHRAGGLTFVDDSIATAPEAAMAGIAAIDGPLAVILGGSDKGALWEALAAAVVARGAIPITYGQCGPRIATAIAAAGAKAHAAATFEQAVSLAIAGLGGRGTVLLSPACASFDLFRGFDHRGDTFAEIARRLAP